MTLFLCEKSIFLPPKHHCMKSILFSICCLFSTWLSAQNVGLGTSTPQSRLHIKGTGGGTQIIIEENAGSVLRISNEANAAGPYIGTSSNHSFSMVSNNAVRLLVAANGNVGINNLIPKSRLTIYHNGGLQIPLDMDEGHAVTIFDSSNFSNNEPRLSLNVGISSAWEYAYIRVKKSTTLGPVPRLLLNPGGGAVVIGGGSDGSNYAQEASDYKFIVGWNAPALFDNKLDVFSNLTVQNGKGIIRNTSGTQLKQVVSSVTVNPGNIAGNSTYIQNVSWSETFSGTPVAAYVGNILSGGGWAELVLSMANVTSSGCTLYIFNPRLSANTPNFTFNVVAVGPQ